MHGAAARIPRTSAWVYAYMTPNTPLSVVVSTLLFAGIVLSGCKSSGERACDVSDPQCGNGLVCLALDGADATCTETCDPSDEDACADGAVCDPLASGEHACFAPVFIDGTITRAEDGAPLPGARVLAADDAGSVVTQVAVTDAAGRYRLAVPVVRDAMGVPVAGTFTLRVSAQDYLPFPSGFRPALPIDATDAAAVVDVGYVAENGSTSVVLIGVPDDQVGLPSIQGVVGGTAPAGTLVVAECSAPPCPFGYADADGSYVIYGVADGSYSVRGYRADSALVGMDVTVEGVALAGVDLAASTDALATISGQVQIVNAPGGSRTSVVLIPASTFQQITDTFVRGEVAPGLRAPEPGAAPSISGGYTIPGVPPGRYAVLAAFENDLLVRDPDPGIAGTQIVFVDVAGADLTVSESFKVTEALRVIEPGADRPTEVASDATVTLAWDDDSGEQSYDVRVYDVFGTEVWQSTEPAFMGSGHPSVTYGGPLEPGMYYQWRVEARDGSDDPQAVSEDLLGVFYVAPLVVAP